MPVIQTHMAIYSGLLLPKTSTYPGHKLVGFPGPQRWVLIDLLDGGGSPVGVTVGADGGLGLTGEEEHGEFLGMLWWTLPIKDSC